MNKKLELADNRTKILLDLLSFSPQDGGFATRIYDLLETSKYLPEFRFTIICATRYRNVLSKYGCEIISIAFPQKLKQFISSVILPFVCRKSRFDALHCEISAIPYLIDLPASACVPDLYFLINKGMNRGGFIKEMVRLYWEKFYVSSLSRAKVLGAISETTRNDILRLTSVRKKTFVVYPVIKKATTGTYIKSWPGDDSPIRILFVGSIVPRKNLVFLLKALKLFKRNWSLDIVGNIWWGFDELEPYIGDSNRTNIHGYVTDKIRSDLMRSSHLIILPSLYEGFGLPAAEAVSLGCLALTSSGSAFDEFVPEDCRFDLDSSEKLLEILNRLDHHSYESMLRRSVQNIEKFSQINQISEYRSLFSKLCEDSIRSRVATK